MGRYRENEGQIKSTKQRKSKILSIDKLHLHEKFTKENFLNLCSLRWSEWGRWRRFFVIVGAMSSIIVSAPSFVMILPCVTVFYLISCTVKNAVDIVTNWKWGPIFPKRRIRPEDVQREIDETTDRLHREGWGKKKKKNESNNEDELGDSDDGFLDSIDSIDGEEELENEKDSSWEDDDMGLPTDSLDEELDEDDYDWDEEGQEKISKNPKKETFS